MNPRTILFHNPAGMTSIDEALMKNHLPHDPTVIFEMLNAYQRTEALRAAIDLDIFGAIEPEGSSSEHIAGKLACSVRGIRILSDYLCILGILTKQGERYFLSEVASKFLRKDRAEYLGAATNFMCSKTILAAMQNLAETVKIGKPKDQGTLTPSHDVWLSFASGMGNLMAERAAQIASRFDFPSDSPIQVLDVSASHGEFGFAFAKRFPGSSIFALDWPNVLELTKQRAEAAGLSKQMKYLPGDAFSTPLPDFLDVILVPNFLHHFSPEKCSHLLKRLHASLRPQGHLIILEFIPNEDRISPPGAAAFALTMLCTTDEGDAFTFPEYREMLLRAGFTSCSLDVFERGMQSLVLAQK